MEAKVSVIMPAYNSEKHIGYAIDSLLAQTFGEWELIVVDDASSDGTESIVREYALKDSRIKYIKNETNSGVTKTRSVGALAASAEWIALLDSDDAWRADKLERQIAFAEEKNASLVFTASDFIDEDNNRIDWTLHAPETIDYRKLLKQDLISNSSVMVKKDLFLKYNVGGDHIAEDFACWLGLLKSGVIAYGIDEPMFIYRISRNTRSSNKLKSARMTWGAYRHVGLSIPEACWYMCFYTVNGILKYRNLK